MTTNSETKPECESTKTYRSRSEGRGVRETRNGPVALLPLSRRLWFEEGQGAAMAGEPVEVLAMTLDLKALISRLVNDIRGSEAFLRGVTC